MDETAQNIIDYLDKLHEGATPATEATLQRVLAALDKTAKVNPNTNPKAKADKDAAKATKELIDKGVKPLEGSLQSTRREAEAASQKIAEMYKTIGSNIASMGTAVKNFATGTSNPTQFIQSMGDAAGKTAGMIPGIGGALKGMIGAASGIFGALMGAAQKTTDMFFKLNDSGASFGGSMTAMRNAANVSGYTMEQFSGAVAKNTEGLARFGGTATEGAQQLSRMGRAIKSQGLDNALFRMGVSLKDQPEFMAQFLTDMSGFGISAKSYGGDFNRMAQDAVKYRKELQIAKALTGESNEQQKARMDAIKKDAAFQAKLRGMTEEERKKVMEMMRQVPEGMQGAAKDMVLFGTVTKDNAGAAAAFPGQIAAIQAGMAGGGEAYRDYVKNNAATLAAEEKNAREVVMLSGQSSSAMVQQMTKVYLGVAKQVDVVANNGIKNAEQELDEASKGIGRGGDNLTKQMNRQANAMQKMAVKLEEIGTKLLGSKFFEIGINVLSTVLENIDKVITKLTSVLGPDGLVATIIGVTGAFVGLKAAMAGGKLLGVLGGGGGGGAGKALGGAGAGVGKGIGGAMKGVGQGIGGAMKGVASGLASLANPMTLIGLGAVVLAIMGIAAAARIAAPAFEPLGKMFKSTLEGIGTVVEKVLGGVSSVVEKIGGAISGIITSIGDSIANVVDKITKMRTAGTQATTEQIERLSKIPGDNMISAAAGIDALKKALDGFDTGSKGFFGNLGDMITGGDKSGGFAGMLERMADAGAKLVPVTSQLDMSKLKFDESLPNWYEKLADSVNKAAEAVEKMNDATAKPVTERLAEGAKKAFGFVKGLFGGSKDAPPPPPTGKAAGPKGSSVRREPTGYMIDQEKLHDGNTVDQSMMQVEAMQADVTQLTGEELQRANVSLLQALLEEQKRSNEESGTYLKRISNN